MASNSPGFKDEKYVCVIGLAPLVPAKTAKDEEHLLQTFYKVLCEYNTNPLLKLQINIKFKIKILETKFNYFEGDQFVTAEVKCSNADHIKKLQSYLEDNTFPTFLSEYLDSTGMGIALGLDAKVKFEIVAFKIDAEQTVEVRKTESVEATKEPEVPKCKNDKNVLIRLFVPMDIQRLMDVCIVSNHKTYQTSNIPGTSVWTLEINSTCINHEFFVEVSTWKSSGIIFKGHYEEKLVSSAVAHVDGNVVHHLTFPYKDTGSYEDALTAFCSIILHQETYKDNRSAFVQLEALNRVQHAHMMSVDYKDISSTTQAKDFIKKLLQSIPNGIHSSNLPAFCYVLHQISRDPSLISRTELIDEQKAKEIIKWYTTVRPGEEWVIHIDKIVAVLGQIYICGLGKRACLTGFIGHTVTFLQEDLLVKLLQKSVSKPNSSMQLYSHATDNELETILKKLMEKPMQSLLEKILRHIIPPCTLEKYVSAVGTLLKTTTENKEMCEKLVELCSQKCSQFLMKISKAGDLKELLECWSTIQTAEISCSQRDLQQTVEKGILECLRVESKLSSICKKNELLQAVLHGSLFLCSEEKINLLERLADAKKGMIRSCVIDCLSEDKFHTLPDASYKTVVTKWLQNTIQCERKQHSPVERIVKIYGHLNSVLELPLVQKTKGLHADADKLVFNAIEQLSFKELMNAVSEIEKNEKLHKLFQNHITNILHGKHSKKSPTDIIWDICGTSMLRLNSLKLGSLMFV